MAYVSYDGSAFLGGKVKGKDLPHPRRCVEYVEKKKVTKAPTEKQLMARAKIAEAGKLRKENPELSAREAYMKANDESSGLRDLFGSAYLGGKVRGRKCVEYVEKKKVTKPPTEKQLVARAKLAQAGKLRKENPHLTAKEAYARANDMSGSALPTRIGLAYRGRAYLGGGLFSDIVRKNNMDGMNRTPRNLSGAVFKGNPDILKALKLKGGCMDCNGRCGMGI